MTEIIDYYISMRSGLFTGFLTIGSFLLTMKTFMITTMKEKYYDAPFYTEILNAHKENDPKIKRLDKLDSFRSLLKISIYGCYTTSLIQLTVGPFISRPPTPQPPSTLSQVAAFACLAPAVLTIILVIICVIALSENMRMYIEKHNN